MLVILADSCICPRPGLRLRYSLCLVMVTGDGAGQVDGEHISVLHVGRGLQMLPQCINVIQYFSSI